ncbi:hypothetical protein WJX72_009057 [[Myrmecia] bisecta]|uniref:tRNA pseudouridine(55) synthase n=1 Tax=[Myrmecia] bisecta TaxID=41462 RepID=A0AAW1PLW9_9CHLO
MRLNLGATGHTMDAELASAENQPQDSKSIVWSERLLNELLNLQVCARCCLRFCGVRSTVYGSHAPTIPQLSQASCDTGGSPATVGVIAALSAKDSTEGLWQPHGGPLQQLADLFRKAGHVCSDFALELMLPGSVLIRDLAIWYHLQDVCPTATRPFSEVIDIKHAARLTVLAPLASLLGMPHNTDSDMRLSLAYVHVGSVRDTDALFGQSGAKRGKQARQWGKGPKWKKQRIERVDIGQSSTPCCSSGSCCCLALCQLLGPVGVSRSALPRAGSIKAAGRGASEAISSILSKMGRKVFADQFAIPPQLTAEAVQLAARCRRAPVYVAGRYLKTERGISNSPWFIDGKRHAEKSVQEEIANVVMPLMRADGYKFMSAGREDVDVRMLGSGRPFILEIQNARAAMPSRDTFAEVQANLVKADTGVEVLKLQGAGKEVCAIIKDGETDKQKSYTALCRIERAVTPDDVALLNSQKDLLLKQYTPTRVAHRRALMVRERLIHEMRGEPVPGSPNYLVLTLRTQAGTYIKEFVHGDNSQTQPHLATLLRCKEPASILQLDVTDIHMDFL